MEMINAFSVNEYHNTHLPYRGASWAYILLLGFAEASTTRP